jgi:GH24 family phage-related lysozyme (muramidase)
MKTGQAGIDLMHRFEGKSLKPYLCPAHIWTIGYGHVLYQDQIKLPVIRKDGYTGILRPF